MVATPVKSSALELSTNRSVKEKVFWTWTSPRICCTLPSPMVTTSRLRESSVRGSPIWVATTDTLFTAEPVSSAMPPPKGWPVSCRLRDPSSVVMVPLLIVKCIAVRLALSLIVMRFWVPLSSLWTMNRALRSVAADVAVPRLIVWTPEPV